MIEYASSVAVITGAGSGLGKALATELAVRGCHTALIDSNASRLTTAVAELSRISPCVTGHSADVGSEAEVMRIASEISQYYGRVHILINNAGISVSAPFEATSSEDFERVLRTNFLGAVNACRVFLPILRLTPPAHILNVASSFAWHGYPGKSAYAASKAALRAFSECLRLECAPANVGVTLLYPGPLGTNLVRDGVSVSEDLRDREDQFLKTRGTPLEAVARRTIYSLPRNPGRIVIGLDYRLMDVSARLSPNLTSRLMGAVARRLRF